MAGADQSPIPELDAILVMLDEGVHGTLLLWGEIPGAYRRERLLLYGHFETSRSVEECRYFVILAKDLGYGDTEHLAASLEEVSRLLNAYVAAILASGF